MKRRSSGVLRFFCFQKGASVLTKMRGRGKIQLGKAGMLL